ncbi:MAG: dodecin domain-containing protein [Acidimicrobiia bacterium]
MSRRVPSRSKRKAVTDEEAIPQPSNATVAPPCPPSPRPSGSPGRRGGSIEDAIRTCLARATAPISDIQSFRIVEVGGKVDDSGAPTLFTVTLDITFGIKDPVDHG